VTEPESESEVEIKNKRRGIYLLPNLFTTAAMFCGFYAVVASMHGFFEAAASAIIVAMVFDGFDGRIARLIHCESEFGAQFDSLSDLVAFGMAPALVALSWSLSSLGKVGWMAAFIFLVCAALRLARFNIQAETADRRYFVGLASPPAAALIATMVWVSAAKEITVDAGIAVVSAIIVVAAGLLMVSNFRYYSFKDIDIKGRIPFVALLAIVFIYVVVFIDPSSVLFLCALTYALSGPVMALIKRKKVGTV